MKHFLNHLFAAFLLIAITLQPRAQSKFEDKVIAHAKRIDVSQLDPGFPSQPFASWFRHTIGAAAKVKWEVNDCGEQTGSKNNPERDLPLCAQAEAELLDGRKVIVVFSVGTQKKGLSKRPGGIYYLGIESGGRTQTISKLHDLAVSLRSNK
jgi:hypothetical protein